MRWLPPMFSGQGDAPAWALAAGDSAAAAQSATPGLADLLPMRDWLTLRQGSRPLVVVAPHGGRRRRDVRRGDSVNDLHTAELAWELAERLDAHAIINHGLDRNDVDLNRISHLSERAPQVLALLRAAVEHAGAGDEAALVLFVHGWNMVLPCCDIGIGLRRRDAVATDASGPAQAHNEPEARLFGRFPTVARGVYVTTVTAIERSLASRGISSAIGRRYSASGRDNAAQLFSGRHAEHAHDDVGALALLALEGRAGAAQLELGIALRWPGPLRQALLDGLVEALAESSSEPAVGASETAAGRRGPANAERAAAGLGTVGHAARVPAQGAGDSWNLLRDEDHHARPSSLEPGYTLQAVLDSEGDAALFAGVEATGPRSMAGRVCIVRSDGSMMLLVGEGPWNAQTGSYQLEGFRWTAGPGGTLDIELDAPMVRYRSHDAYLDLEAGLAAAQLVDARVRLRFEPQSEGYGRLRGRIDAEGTTIAVDVVAFTDRGGRREPSAAAATVRAGRVRVMVAAPQGGVVRIESATAPGACLDVDSRGGVAGALGRIVARGGDAQVAGFEEARIVARVPVWRPGPDGVWTRWSFGIVRCRFQREPGAPIVEAPGIFDLSEVLGRASTS